MAQSNKITGRNPNQAASLVSADQVTIFGNGTSKDPLRGAAAGVSFLATYADLATSLPPIPGMPVYATAAAIAAGTVAAVSPSQAGSGATQAEVQAIGLVAEVITSSTTAGVVRVQSTGVLSLTEAQWDAAAGISGGLSQGDTFYVDGSPNVGQLSASPPALGFTVQCGVALSSTAMVLSMPSVPLAP